MAEKIVTVDGARISIVSAFDIVGIVSDWGEKDMRGAPQLWALHFDRTNAITLRNELNRVLGKG